LLLLQSFFKPLKTILERYNQLQNSLASADRVFHILDEVKEPADGQSLDHDFQGKIEVRDLTFAYSSESDDVLKDINVDIPAGSSTAVVGRTGSGKTTLVSLLQRLYRFERGQILIDGQDIQKWRLHAYRSRIGVIQQDGFIFSGTILSNITLDNPEISRERAEWAARQAQAMEIIERHGGFDAKIQERGANLSVGERQLIAFARVLAFDPDILILDEATANIDSINEARIQLALKNVIHGRTSVIIAHRLSTIVACDQILVLDHGHLVQKGRHSELVEQPGVYQQLYHSHFHGQTEGASMASAPIH
jgi:ATP-binding cassette subfamily B protein